MFGYHLQPRVCPSQAPRSRGPNGQRRPLRRMLSRVAPAPASAIGEMESPGHWQDSCSDSRMDHADRAMSSGIPPRPKGPPGQVPAGSVPAVYRPRCNPARGRGNRNRTWLDRATGLGSGCQVVLRDKTWLGVPRSAIVRMSSAVAGTDRPPAILCAPALQRYPQ